MPASKSIPPSVTNIPIEFTSQSSGNVAFDSQYFYVKYNGWRRFPLYKATILDFNFPLPSNDGDICTDNQYFYIVVNNVWLRMPSPVIKTHRQIYSNDPPINIRNTKLTTFPRSTDNYGRWGMISFNAEYFCMWGSGKWHKIPIAPLVKPKITPITSNFTWSYIRPIYESVFVTNPTDVYGDPHSNVTFSVSSSAIPGPVNLQWFSGSISNSYALIDGGRFSGSNSPTLYIANIVKSDVGTSYYITARNQHTLSETSSIAHIYLYPPKITLNPSPQSDWTTLDSIFWSLPHPSESTTSFADGNSSITASFSASFVVSASGGGNPLTYQWYLNGTPLADNDRITGSYVLNSSLSGALLQINALQFSDSGNISATVSDDGGTSTSKTASLIIWDNTFSRSMADTMSLVTPLLFGSPMTQLPYSEGTQPVINTLFLSGQVRNTTLLSNANETASVSTTFDSGYIFNAVVPIYGGNETASVSMTFDSGYVTNVLVPVYGGSDTSSVSIAFESGSLQTVVVPINISDPTTMFVVSLLSGNVV